jgi:hypothetical protein
MACFARTPEIAGPNARWHTGKGRGGWAAGLIVFALITLTASPDMGAEILWGFEGEVTRVGDDNTLPGLTLGSRFSGTTRFNTDPAGTTEYDSGMRSYNWNGEGIGVQVTAGGLDFSMLGRPDASMSMSVKNNGFSIPHSRRADSIHLNAISDLVHFGPAGPLEPGQIGIDSWGFLRNIYLQFHDFDQTILSDSSLVTRPFDVSAMDLATIDVGMPFGDSNMPAGFGGTIDRVFTIAVPEPSAAWLLALGLITAGLWYRFVRGPSWRIG